jgi:hypothetical protein
MLVGGQGRHGPDGETVAFYGVFRPTDLVLNPFAGVEYCRASKSASFVAPAIDRLRFSMAARV